mgnify:CR=1 FL=1
MSDDKYESHIKAVLSECPDADIDEVKASFKKYEEEFYIPPQDALRSIVRRFQGEKQTTSPSKKNAGIPYEMPCFNDGSISIIIFRISFKSVFSGSLCPAM